MDEIGLVGSPSTTAKVTVDIMEDATGSPLRGQLVSLTHQMDEQYLIGLGTVTEIRTSNRWHEDPNMRGVLKRHGSLPHLSAVGDVRTADVAVQAVYLSDTADPGEGNPPTESGGSLAMSPTTGAEVHRITDTFLSDLLRRHRDELVYLGTAYGMEDVKLPMTLRHFGPVLQGGIGEAYHTGIFGMSGSGKSGFATYLLAAYARHPKLGILVMDPQGQFSSEVGLPFSLQSWSRRVGRKVDVHSVSRNLRLRQNAPLLTELLEQTRFFRDMLSIKARENRESATEEFRRILQHQTGWKDSEPRQLLRTILGALSNDTTALTRIYADQRGRDRVLSQIASMLNNPSEFQIALNLFEPLHSLFTASNSQGERRVPMESVLHGLLAADSEIRPLVVIDLSTQLSGAAGDPDSPAAILDSTPIKARLLREICSTVARVAEQRFGESRADGNPGLNTMVVFDEAQRFAAETPEDEESKALADRLVDYVRTTRKYGLGWTFITQEVGSLRRGIYSQLRVRSFGYGLTSGTELHRLRETIGDPEALELYRSFVDPQAIQPSEYSFMLTGPVSPLSFTGAPVFLSVYTDFDKFKRANGISP